jgi:hypothetical protein
MTSFIVLYENPDEAALHTAWVVQGAAKLDQGPGGVYVNFVGNEGEARRREAYPGATWDRLAAVKARYDPANLFRLNQNIPPKAATAGSGRSSTADRLPDARPGFSEN